VFDPLGKPCLGTNATLDGTALGDGVYALLQNVRVANGVFTVRDGIADLSASSLPAGWCVGAAQVSIDGTEYVYAAFDTGTHIRVYRSTGVSFTEITSGSSSSQYGNTRFTTGCAIAVGALSSVNSGTGVITFGSDPLYVNGQKFTPSASVDGLTAGTDYYLGAKSAATYKIYTSYAKAILGSTDQVTLTGTTLFDVVPTEGYKRVSFSVVKYPTKPTAGILSTEANKDIVVISDGVKVLVGNSTLLAPHQKCWLPDAGYEFSQRAGFYDYVRFTGSWTDGTSAGGDVLQHSADTASVTQTFIAFALGGGGNVHRMTFNAGAAANSEGWYYDTNIANLGLVDSGQFVLFYAGTTGTSTTVDPDIWDKTAVYLSNGTFPGPTWYKIYDPTVSTYNRPIIVDAGSGVLMAVFDIDKSLFPTGTVSAGVKFRYVDSASAALSAQYAIWSVAACGGGDAPNNITYGLSYYHTGGFCESEGKVCRNRGGMDLSRFGMKSVKNSVKIPVSSGVKYKWYLYAQQPPLTGDGLTLTPGNGLDYILIYSSVPIDNQQRPGKFYLCGQSQIATYTSSWAAYNSASDYQKLEFVNLNLQDVTYQREMPPAYHRVCPPHTCAVVGDGRLMVGNTKHTVGATRGGSVQCSKSGDAFDFSEFVRFNSDGSLDATSPVQIDIGPEKAQNLISTANSRSDQQVSSPCVLVTDKSVWVIDTRDSIKAVSAKLVAPYGTKAPDSLCFGGGAVYWFDNEHQIRRMFMAVDSPSKYRAEALWDVIPTTTSRAAFQANPRVERVWCQYFRDSLYVGYTTTSGHKNTRVSVYDTHRDIWYDDLLASGDVEKAFVWPVAGDKPQLRGFSLGNDTDFSTASTYYQIEKSGQTTDAGSAIAHKITTRYIHYASKEEPWSAWMWGRLGAVADKVTAKSLTIVKTVMPSGSTTTGTINLESEVTGNQAVRWETVAATDTKPGVAGVACQIDISGTMGGGKKIYAIYMDIDERGGSSDVNN